MKTSGFNYSIKSFTVTIFLVCVAFGSTAFAQESSFQTPVEINDGKATNLIDVKHIDFDMDGELDLVTASATEIRWYKGKGGGEFEDSELLFDIQLSGEYSELRSFDVGDIDGDGDMDIIYSDISDIIAFENDGELNMSELNEWSYPRVKEIFFTSYLENGRPEIITVGELGITSYEIAENNELVERRSFGGNDKAIYTDFDGDNIMDLVVVEDHYTEYDEGDLTVYFGLNSSMVELSYNFSIPELNIPEVQFSVTDVVVADMNNDGFKDIVFSINGSASYTPKDMNNGYLVYIQNDGNTGFKDPVLSDVSVPGYSSLTTSDLDGDELPEIIAAQVNDEYTTGEIKAISFDTSSGFSAPEQLFEKNLYFNKLFSYDIDQNSLMDLVGNSEFGDHVGWYKNLGEGEFGEFTFIAQSKIASPAEIAELDIDGDGLNDLIVVSKYPNKAVLWYKNNGNYSFEEMNIIEPDLSKISQLELGDLDGDGLQDIIIGIEEILERPNSATQRSDSAYHTIYWYKNQNNGTFSSRKFIATDTSFTTDFTLADYNNDGNLDIVLSTENLSVYVNGGDGENFEQVTLGLGSSYGNYTTTGDIDGDSKEELVTISVKDSLSFEGPFPITKRYYQVTVSSSDTLYSRNTNLEKGAYQLSGIKALDLNNDNIEEIVFASNLKFTTTFLYLLDFSEAADTFVQLVDSSNAGFTGLTVGDFTEDGQPDFITTENTYSDYTVDFPYKFGGGIFLYQNDGDLAFRKVVQPDSLRIDVSGLRTVHLGTSTAPEVLSFSAKKEWILLYPSFNSLPVSTESGPYKPQSFSLSQNYPNPFNPTTTIKYSIPAAGQVKLKVYNLLGQLVQTLVDQPKIAGTHQIRFNASALASGVYIYRLEAAGKVQTRKMILIK